MHLCFEFLETDLNKLHMQIKVCCYIFESFIFFTIFPNKEERKQTQLESK